MFHCHKKMATKDKLFELLSSNADEFISGQIIADELKLSRNSIWKGITALKKDGYIIESKPHIGYRLAGESNLLSKEIITKDLRVPCTVEVHNTVTSTNDMAKKKIMSHKPVLLIANRQSTGRGRLGRSFESPGGTGLYLTIALKPGFSLEKSLYVTMAAAVSVCRAIEKVCDRNPQINGKNPQMKWGNDIFIENKKVCGILTEAQTNFETGQIDSLIIGIGVNCFPGNLPNKLKEIAGSISEKTGNFSRNRLAAEIINETLKSLDRIEDKSFLTEYKSRCFILGHEIKVHPQYDKSGIPAKALDIAEDGGLIVEYIDGTKKGETETLHTGEISIRLPR